jgi:Fur family transcriptional regulator, ferric uptake regulator
MTTHAFSTQAEQLLTGIGTRVTPARVRVLAFLLAQQSAATHHDIEQALDRHEKIDRVTLYRTLDWLVAQDIAHKVLGADRAWRFRANQSAAGHHQHAHFKCEQCATTICLNSVPAAKNTPALPKGYVAKEVEMTVKGLCPACA